MKRIVMPLAIATALVFNCSFKFADEPSPAEITDQNRIAKYCTAFNFRYLETENVLYTPVVRHIEIFLDEKAFTETNLKALFEYLSKQNPDPVHLTVEVKTNWAQLPMATDCPGYGVSEQPADPHEYDYLQAIYSRRKDQEYFRYSPSTHVDQGYFKTVEMKKK